MKTVPTRNGRYLPLVGVTLGDPCGISPEVTARALADPGVRSRCRVVVFGDEAIWQRAIELTGANATLPVGQLKKDSRTDLLVPITDLSLSAAPYGGQTDDSAKAQKAYLEAGVEALTDGTIDALCTAPITKSAIVKAGFEFPGHTEFLAQRMGANRVAMMMAGPRLRVCLATIHLALSQVPAAITEERVMEKTRLCAEGLTKWFGIAKPHIAVCGLNPHAGEGGRFGREEIDIIEPAIEKLREEGHDVSGPHPADAVMVQAAEGRYDAVVAMYHDQGLPPVRTIHFDDAVNLTLGLPHPRTSPDHGTALDIAGRGLARHQPMSAAMRLAASMAIRSKES